MREENVPKEKPRETPKNVGKDVLTPPTRNRDVKYFKCLGNDKLNFGDLRCFVR